MTEQHIDDRGHSRSSTFVAIEISHKTSDVNKDWTHKDQDKDKDQSYNDNDKDKG